MFHLLIQLEYAQPTIFLTPDGVVFSHVIIIVAHNFEKIVGMQCRTHVTVGSGVTLGENVIRMP